MERRRESFLLSILRSFLTTLFGTIGVGIALIMVIIMIGAISKDSSPEQDYKPKILADAKGERKALGKKDPVILQLNITGMIGLKDLTTEKIRRLLIESREDDLKNDRVKALLLYINSPGGTVADSDGIYRAVMEYKQRYQLPVYAYIDGICASGGYMIAAAADKIFSSESSLIGSVGVVTPPFFNLSKVLETVGVQSLTISAGKGKDAMNPFRPWKEGEDNSIREIIEEYYDIFVDLIAENRPRLSKEKLVNDFGAKVYAAKRAAQLGYIDTIIGSPSVALNALVEKADLKEGKYRVVELKSKEWVRELFDSKSLFTHTVSLPEQLEIELTGKPLYLYRPERG